MTFGFAGLTQAAGDVAAGQEKTTICAACHSADGNSLTPSFPKLAGQGERYLIKQLMDVKSGKRSIPVMAGVLDNFTDQDMADVAAYYASQTVSLGTTKPELLEAGERLYRAGNLSKGIAACAACHSPTGQGIALAGYPGLSGQHAEYIELQLKSFRTEMRDNDDAKIMRQVSALLSDKEITAVASYIQGLSK